jgi:hypothetical protein
MVSSGSSAHAEPRLVQHNKKCSGAYATQKFLAILPKCCFSVSMGGVSPENVEKDFFIHYSSSVVASVTTRCQ